MDPGLNPFLSPPIYTGGIGPNMTEITKKVADGFITHLFDTRESALHAALFSLEPDLVKLGRSRRRVES